MSRGGTRSRPATGNINQIEETDENAPEPEPKKPEPEKEEPPKMEVSAKKLSSTLQAYYQTMKTCTIGAVDQW